MAVVSKNCVKYKYCARLIPPIFFIISPHPFFLFFFFLFSMLFCSCSRMHCVSLISVYGLGMLEGEKSIKTIWMRRWRWWVWVKSGSVWQDIGRTVEAGEGRQEEGQTTSQVRQSKAKPKSLHAWNRVCKAGHNGQRMMQDSGLHCWKAYVPRTQVCHLLKSNFIHLTMRLKNIIWDYQKDFKKKYGQHHYFFS